jgi:hypothetical protein
MKITRFALPILLSAMFIWVTGCVAPKPTPDPLAGFYVSSLGNLDNNKAIMDDYKDYIQKNLSAEERKYAGPIFYFEDGSGQHAVRIEIGLNGTSWEHVLIYDKDNKRIKTIKYVAGHYAC